jgi:hypothetical protein
MTADGIPRSLLGRIGRLGTLVASDPAHLKTTVAGSVQALINGGLRTMLLGKLKRVLIASMGGVLVGGTLWYNDARSGQSARPSARPVGRQAQSKDEGKDQVRIPAPRRLAVAAGHGKILAYALDDKGERIRARPEVKDGPFRQVERETRWAVVTGVIDHHKVQKALIMAHRQPLPVAERLYCRVELERQALRKDGDWSDWGMVDMEANLSILDNVPAIEEERVASQFRVDGLVDPLPFLTDSKWRGADYEEFLPGEKEGPPDRPPSKEVPAQPKDMRGLMTPAQDDREGRSLPRDPRLGLQRDRPPVLMVRSLDFTVEPGRTYRYRARVVLFNRDYQRGNPRDRNKWIFGPWSEATDTVAIPSP